MLDYKLNNKNISLILFFIISYLLTTITLNYNNKEKRIFKDIIFDTTNIIYKLIISILYTYILYYISNYNINFDITKKINCDTNNNTLNLNTPKITNPSSTYNPKNLDIYLNPIFSDK